MPLLRKKKGRRAVGMTLFSRRESIVLSHGPSARLSLGMYILGATSNHVRNTYVQYKTYITNSRYAFSYVQCTKTFPITVHIYARGGIQVSNGGWRQKKKRPFSATSSTMQSMREEWGVGGKEQRFCFRMCFHIRFPPGHRLIKSGAETGLFHWVPFS